MADISTQVANRLAWARSVLTAMSEYRDAILDALEDDYDRDSLARVLDDMEERFRNATEAMEEAELEYTDELADDDAVRNRRDELIDELRNRLFRASDKVENSFGEPAVETYGLSDTPPSQPDDLLSYTSNTVHSLQHSPRSTEDVFGDEIDTESIADALDETHGELESVLHDVDREKRAADTARAERDEAVDEWEFVFRGTADTFSGLCLLAGRDDLAERVRPTRRAASGRSTPSDEDDGPSGEGESPSDETESESSSSESESEET